jgi:hypothetical protein
MRAYAGVGSRETPPDVLVLMEQIADRLAAEGWTLRSGNAPGADQAFARGHLRTGCNDRIEIYLPWKGFEAAALNGWEDAIVARPEPQPEAYPIAEEFHPNWAALKRGGRALQARNVHQVLGPDVTYPGPVSRAIVCWTPGARGGGGTGQAIRIARNFAVPVFDLADKTTRRKFEAKLVSDLSNPQDSPVKSPDTA